MQDALQEGSWESEKYLMYCQDWLKAHYPFAKRCYLTSSCTQALFLAAKLTSLGPKDEVILPSFTHVSTGAAFAQMGCRLVFAEVCATTMTLSLSAVKKALTPHTRAIVITHYGGFARNMHALKKVAEEAQCLLIEDNAHGILAESEGRFLGGFGQMACMSFERQKNVQCGQGGVLLINDAQYLEKADILYHGGTNRTSFFHGKEKRYEWKCVSEKYVLSELLAAYLYGGLQEAKAINSVRKGLFEHYITQLNGQLPSDVGLPAPDNAHNGHLFFLIVASSSVRAALQAHLLRHHIESRFHYTPLHLSSYGKRYCRRKSEEKALAMTTRCAEGLLRLPMHTQLRKKDVERVCEAVKAFF